MKLDETDLRAALNDVAVTTPVPDRWDAIVAGSARARRRRTIAFSGSGLVALAAAIIVAVVALAGSTARFEVTAGSPIHAPNAAFAHGPSIALSKLTGGHLAFVSGSNLFVVDGATQTARQLTHSGDASALAWSADGEWLAFSVRNAPGYEDYTTWITRADGTHARPLDGMGDVFAWSPTGHYLAVGGYCCTSDLRGGLFVVNPDREQNHQLVPEGSNIMSIAWAPDGTAVGYTAAAVGGTSANPSAWTVGTDGTHLRRVGAGQLATWSPDGHWLLLADNSISGSVELVRVADGSRHRLGGATGSDPRDPATWSAYSPSGETVAFVANDARGSALLDVCTVADASCRSLAGTSTASIFGPSFSPDGTQLTYVGNGELRVVTIANGAVRTLDQLGRDLLQGAGDGVHITRGTYPNVPEWLSDGTILYRHGDELRVIDPATGTPKVVVHPIGFSESGANDQGLPGGTPLAENRLVSHLGH